MKHKHLIYFSWAITISALIFVYGGFHPDEMAKVRILNFSLFLVVLAHLPALIEVLMQILKKELNGKDMILLLVSLLIQFYLLGR